MLYIYGRCKKMTFRMGAESQHNVIKKVEMRGSMDKGWTALTKEMESELITDARKNESRITTWRERQIYLVDLAKKALVHKLGHYLPEDSEEDKVKISDRFLAQYYNCRFTSEKEISADMLQRTRDVLREYREYPRSEERMRDRGRSLHFDVANSLAEMADIALVPLWDDMEVEHKESSLDDLLARLLVEIQMIAEDTHEYLDEKGNPIERTGLFFKIFFHLNEYVGKLTNAELDNMNDEKIIQLTTDLQVMMIHLNEMQKKLKETTEETTESGFLMKFESGRNSEGEGQMWLELKGDTEPGAQMRFEPRTSENQNNPASNQQRKPSGQENRMSKYLLKSMLITLDLAFTKVVIESCLRGLPYNSNFRKESELRERLQKRIGLYCRRISKENDD